MKEFHPAGTRYASEWQHTWLPIQQTPVFSQPTAPDVGDISRGYLGQEDCAFPPMPLQWAHDIPADISFRPVLGTYQRAEPD